MQTYWLKLGERRPEDHEATPTETSQSSYSGNEDVHVPDEEELGHQAPNAEINSKTTRLVNWNVEVLRKLLKHIVASRRVANYGATSLSSGEEADILRCNGDQNVFDEFAEIIQLPKFDPNAVAQKEDIQSVVLPEEVVKQLKHYVTRICSLYRDNPFHNFEHASHVSMSVSKLLSRIVAPNERINLDAADGERNQLVDTVQASSMHDHTYGITSSPVTQFACVFAALIHDLVSRFGVLGCVTIMVGSEFVS